MFRSRTAVAVIVAAAVAATAGCSSSRTASPSETQQGAAPDLNRPPQAGGAGARCRDLPSGEDLKKWLRAAPGVEGEAGGLFSGQMEWASIVNRQGELCATAVATDDPASAWPSPNDNSSPAATTINRNFDRRAGSPYMPYITP